jgi:hypothetical protein
VGEAARRVEDCAVKDNTVKSVFVGLMAGLVGVVVGIVIGTVVVRHDASATQRAADERREVFCEDTVAGFAKAFAPGATIERVVPITSALRPAVRFCVASKDRSEVDRMMAEIEDPSVGGDRLVQIIGDAQTRLTVVRGRATRVLELLHEGLSR